MSDELKLTEEEIRTLEGMLEKLTGPGAFLPPPLFRFVTQVTALPNVDLIVHDADRGVLLAWRDDALGAGWHVPGSIIRHGEEISNRISGCAEDEFGCELRVADQPFAILQLFSSRYHNIALCYRATLAGVPRRRVLDGDEVPNPGDLRWFRAIPDDVYPTHVVYREIIEALERGDLEKHIRIFTQPRHSRDGDRSSEAGAISFAPLR